MATEESGNQEKPASKEAGAKDEAATTGTEATERGGRMNAAKAFYRAMYAGEDVVPDEFGLAGKAEAVQERQGPCGNCAYLEQQLAEAQAKATENENLYKRMAADFENYRRRLDREREEFAATGTQKGIEAILPAMDDLDRAKQTLTTSVDPKQFLESMNLIYNRFTKCLEGLGIKPLEVIGEPFDPRNHEPVQEIQTNLFPDGAVMHELRKGYSYKDKILRPTLVNVASNPSGVVEAPPPPAAPAEPAGESGDDVVASDKQPQAKEAAKPEAEKAEKETEAPDESAGAAVEAIVAEEVSLPAEAEEPIAVSEVEPTVVEEVGADKSSDNDELEATEIDNTLDALNDALKNLVGADDEKGADTRLDDEDHFAASEKPAVGSAASKEEKGKPQKVYDITDSDSE